jgi:hypothetical protein
MQAAPRLPPDFSIPSGSLDQRLKQCERLEGYVKFSPTGVALLSLKSILFRFGALSGNFHSHKTCALWAYCFVLLCLVLPQF